MHNYEYSNRQADQLAIALGWFSVALGATEILAPRRLASAIGLADTSTSTIQAFGVREIASGLAILMRPDQPLPMWSRVGGDAVDLSYLASAMNDPDNDRGRILAAMAAVLGVTVADVLSAQRLRRRDGYARDDARSGRRTSIHVEEVATINKPVQEIYRAWKNFEQFPSFMRHLESVRVLDGRRSRWRAKAPAGMTVEWEAEMVEDREEEMIAWRSVAGSQIQNSGTVQFRRAPAGRGTEVRVRLDYQQPAGRVGKTIASMFGEEPEQQIRDDLRRFKQLLEAGEVAVSDGIGLWRPSQPAETAEQARTLAGVRS